MQERLSLDNQDGWNLDLRRTVDANRLDPDLPPLVLIPGYGMNTHVLGYHPDGVALIDYLASQGFEVWDANLRGQGGSRRTSGSMRIGFRELALTDVPRVLEFVQNETRSSRKAVHGIGCSLGATLLYAYLAHNRQSHGLCSVTSIGGPLRWNQLHPALQLLASRPELIGLLPIRGTRKLARAAIPVIRRFPKLAAMYMNAEIIDLDQAEELTKTVDNPHPHLNRQVAHWLKNKDLEVAGLNVTEGLHGLEIPVLCVVANGDGVVPPEAVLSIRDAQPVDVEVLDVGNDEVWFAHADLFVSKHARDEVFAPLARWLRARS